MVNPRLKRAFGLLVPLLGASLIALLLASLYLISNSLQNASRLEPYYLWLMLANVGGVLFLGGLIAVNVFRLFRAYRKRRPGARLTTRFVITFSALGLVPVLIVFYFSVSFLQRGIDSWFHVQVDQALQDALDLSRASLDERMGMVLKQTRQVALDLSAAGDEMISLRLNDLRSAAGASEMNIIGLNNLILATSSESAGDIVPTRLGEGIALRVRQGQPYIALDPLADGLYIHVAVPMVQRSAGGDPLVLQALYPLAGRIGSLADSVEQAHTEYRELVYLREPLKQSFTLALLLALVLSVMSAVWMAFVAASRLLGPISILAHGTRQVAEGRYDTRLPQVGGRDELGFLVQSFNQMTRRIAESQEEVQRSRVQAEKQQLYLQTVLQHLTSGVLTLSEEGEIKSVNDAAVQILGAPLATQVGRDMRQACLAFSYLEPLCDRLLPHMEDGLEEWEEEVRLFGERGRQVLICRGVKLPDVGGVGSGYVLVIDEVTALIQAQRDAAWSEVARRLAHEIKNPLTPIQLSAERLRRKYLGQLPEKDGEVLDRATRTIVQQVEDMKRMVNDFAAYARTPQARLEPLDLNELVSEVVYLYRGGAVPIRLKTAAGPLWVEADAGRLRQLLNNLLVNAQQALEGQPGGGVLVRTRWREDAGQMPVELLVEDNGPGFPEEVLDHLFEPYVTTKPKGTGLGLAIVKKVVEEHSGQLIARNRKEGGAQVCIWLPGLHGQPASPMR